MTDDKQFLPDVHTPGPVDAYAGVAPLPPTPVDDEEGTPFSIGRYVRALRRFWWLVVLGALAGAGAGYVAWQVVEPQYAVEGSLWIEIDDRSGGGPIRQAGLLESAAWLGLLRSYSVLDSVVLQERLYLVASPQHAAALEDFTVEGTFSTGTYALETTGDGRWALHRGDGTVLDQGGAGDAIGEELGFRWIAPAGPLAAAGTIEFTVITARDAARQLNFQIQAAMDPQGNFIKLNLRGTDPVGIASVLNSVMERHVEVAAELKRAKLDEEQRILSDQLRYAEAELQEAERALEEFRIATITLPSDQGPPIATGLLAAQDPLFGSYFRQKVALEQLKNDRARLAEILEMIPSSGLRIEALEGIGALAGSVELGTVIQELVAARAQLRALRTRYEDDYQPVQAVLAQVERLETSTVPGLIRALDDELAAREVSLTEVVEAASGELTEIPPRTIEQARLRRQVAIQETLYNTLRSRVEAARLAAASSIPDVRVLDSATVPEAPTNDQRLKLVLLLFAASLGAGAIGAILMDRVDPLFRDPLQVESEMNLHVLSAIPPVDRTDRANRLQVLEAFRMLRLNVAYAYGHAGPLVLTISSPAQGEGKTLVAANLAMAFAAVGERTLLIDADTRRGDAHALVGAERKPGLSDYLGAKAGREIVQTTSYENLYFVGSGSRQTSSPELVTATRMQGMLGALKRMHRVIIIDSPPLAAGGDAMALAAMSGALALVVRSGSTNREMTMARLEALQRFPVRVLGVVLNDFQGDGASRYTQYSNYLPGYEATEEEAKALPTPKAAFSLSLSRR